MAEKEEGWWWRRRAKKKSSSSKTPGKKVRFSAPRTKRKEDIGGAIRAPKAATTTIDRKRAAFTKALYNEPSDSYQDSFSDVESRMYSHYGGQMSGKGARFDPPHVRQFVHNTLKQYPRVLAAYNRGTVINPPVRTVHHKSGSTPGPDIVDFGGSLHPLSHSENGRLVSFDNGATSHSQHFLYR